MSNQRRRVLKVLLLGDSFVGKSSLIQRFVNKEFSQQFRATIGCDFLMKDVRTETGTCTVQLWDTAGQERFESLGRAFYRGADGLILVFDITNQESFLSLETRRKDFLDLAGVTDIDSFPIVLIANKIDRENERHVKMEDVKKWVGQFPSMMLYECSAKTDIGVNEAFQELCGKMIRREETMKTVVVANPSGLIVQRKNKETVKKCC